LELTTDRYEASHGLFATAELLVKSLSTISCDVELRWKGYRSKDTRSHADFSSSSGL